MHEIIRIRTHTRASEHTPETASHTCEATCECMRMCRRGNCAGKGRMHIASQNVRICAFNFSYARDSRPYVVNVHFASHCASRGFALHFAIIACVWYTYFLMYVSKVVSDKTVVYQIFNERNTVISCDKFY